MQIFTLLFSVKVSKKHKKAKKSANDSKEGKEKLVEKDEKGNPSSVNYSRAVTVLLGGFKELYKEIEELKKRI